MRRKLTNMYLENRIAKLEKLIYEKTVGRGGNDSPAYRIWKMLMDEGPKTRPEIRNRFGSSAIIVDMERENCVSKNGNQYAANPDYVWDDVGVIRRHEPAAPSFADIRDRIVDTPEDPLDETPVEQPARRGRTPRAPREPRQPVIIPNLFSRKFAEVKAAVDAGQDVNQVNDKDKTPIVYACNDPKGAAGESGQIVEYLLQHGADANDRDGNKPIIFVAISRLNKPVVQALMGPRRASTRVEFKHQKPIEYAIREKNIYDDTLVPLAKDLFASRAYPALISAFNNGNISKDVYEAALNKALNTPDARDELNASNITSYMIQNIDRGSSLLHDKYVTLTGNLPKYSEWLVREANNAGKEQIYKDCVDAANGKLKIQDIRKYLEAAKAAADTLGKPKDFLYKFVTPEWLKKTAKSSNDRSNIYSLINHAQYFKRPDLLKAIADANLKYLNAERVFSALNLNSISNKDLRPETYPKIILDIVGDCSNLKEFLSDTNINIIKRSNDKYLVDWAIDKGLGQRLINSPIQASDYCLKALTDAGFDLTPKDYPSPRRWDSYENAKANLLNCIDTDEWHRSMDSILEKYPKLLKDDDVLDAIDEAEPGNTTVFRLKRLINDLEKDVYDM